MKYLPILIFILILGSLFFPEFSELHAASLRDTVSGNLSAGGEAAGLGESAPSAITVGVRIINAALSLLGVSFFALTVYGGFRYLTAGGDEQKVEEAKGIIRTAIIGVLIILSAWAITRFVVEGIGSATIEAPDQVQQTQ